MRVLRIVQGLNGTCYIVMELLGGANLEDVVERDGPLATPRFLAIFAQILDGMRAVHALGILHRDIKPANIVLEDRGPVLIDFGAARALAMQRKAGFSALVTDGYSPPEQYSSRNAQAEASDIYALAATAHFLLSGEAPPPSVARHAGEELAPAASLRPDLPGDVAMGIDHALRLRIDERPQSIGTWLAEMPSLTAAPKPEKEVVYVERRAAGINRRGLLLVAGGLAVAGAAAALLLSRPDGGVSSSAGPLAQRWTRRVSALSSEPYPGIAFAADRVLVAAHDIDEACFDRLLLARFAASGKETGRDMHGEPGSRAHAVLPLEDGGMVVGGESQAGALVLRLDKSLEPVWSKIFAPGSISTLMRLGDKLVAGLVGPQSSGQARLLFLSEDGGLDGDITLLDRRGDSVQQIAPLADGAIAVLGARLEQRLIDGQGRDVAGLWLGRVAPSGEELWRVAESGLGYANGIDVIEAGDDLFVSGKTSPNADPGNYRTMVMRVSREGLKAWTRWDYEEGPSTGRGLAVGGESVPRLYMAGWTGNPPRARLAQLGPDGDLVWQEVSARARGFGDVAADIVQDHAGGLYMVGMNIPDEQSLELTLSHFA